jgi:hypothetical protein
MVLHECSRAEEAVLVRLLRLRHDGRKRRELALCIKECVRHLKV